MTFQDFKSHFTETKVSVLNHLKNQVTENAEVFVLTRKHEKLSRKRFGGAHFLVTRKVQKGKFVKDQLMFPIYWTRASAYRNSNDKELSYCIRVDVLQSLSNRPTKVVFERESDYSKPVTLDYIKKFAELSHNEYFLPESKIEWVAKDVTRYDTIDYDSFKPEYLPYYTFNHANHCTKLHVIVKDITTEYTKIRFEGDFDSITEMFTMLHLDKANAKLSTVMRFVRSQKNFVLNGRTFVFDPTWDMAIYDTRKTKAEKVVDEVVKTVDAIEEEITEFSKETNRYETTKVVRFDDLEEDLDAAKEEVVKKKEFSIARYSFVSSLYPDLD